MSGLLLKKDADNLRLSFKDEDEYYGPPIPPRIRENEPSLDYDYLVDYLKKAEGFRGEPYDDSGFKSIGYGHQLTEDEYNMYSKGVDETKAEELLRADIQRAEENAKAHWGEGGWNAMDSNRRAMAVDFAYNLGRSGLRKFPKFSKALRNGDWEMIAQEHFRYDTALKDKEGNPRPLTHRNNLFYNHFIHDKLTKHRRIKNLGRELEVK